MKRSEFLARCAALCLGLAATLPAGAFLGGGGSGIVFDPTNYSANSVTSLKAVLTEIHAAKQLLTQLQTLETELKQQLSLKAIASNVFDGAMKDLTVQRQATNALINADSSLQSTLTDQAAFADRLISMARKARLEPKDAMGVLAKQYAQGLAEARNAYQTADRLNQSIESNQEARRRLQGALANADGVNQTMGVVSASLDVLIGQNNDMLAMMANQLRVKARSEADTNARGDDKRQVVEDMQKRWRLSTEAAGGKMVTDND